MTLLLRAIITLILTAFLCSCDLSKVKTTAEKAVDTFHQEYNDKKDAEIYSSAAPEFRSATNEADYNVFIQTVRSQMGAYKSGTLVRYVSLTNARGTSIILNYKSEFDHAEGTEVFTFVIVDGAAKMQRYDVNSSLLPPS